MADQHFISYSQLHRNLTTIHRHRQHPSKQHRQKAQVSIEHSTSADENIKVCDSKIIQEESQLFAIGLKCVSIEGK